MGDDDIHKISITFKNNNHLYFPGIQGSRTQTAEIVPDHEITTNHPAIIEKSGASMEYVKISDFPKANNDATGLDDVAIDSVKVFRKPEIRPESASSVLIPIENNTNVILHDKNNEMLVKHAVEHLDDQVLKRLLSKKMESKQQKNAQYDEITGELKNGDHPCRRECKEGEPGMICYYHFSIEWYQTMSKACYNCPYNESDCSRLDCIPADGMSRALTVINRKMPGPLIEVRFDYKIVFGNFHFNSISDYTYIHFG